MHFSGVHAGRPKMPDARQRVNENASTVMGHLSYGCSDFLSSNNTRRMNSLLSLFDNVLYPAFNTQNKIIRVE
jgi:hypothetical protein